jgi:hypothetical protein
MNGSIHDPTPGDEFDRLLDDELHAIARPPAVDLRARVMTAIERREAGAGFRVPRRAFALAAAAVVIAAVALTTWRPWNGRGDTGREVRRDARHDVRPAVPPAVRPDVRMKPDATYETGEARAELRPAASTPVASGFTRASEPASPRVAASALIVMDDDDDVPVSALPGAPAGELGDPLQPLPARPAIAFAPIETAPPVSEAARPVTDFPTDNPVPGVPNGTAGQSGGPRR